MASLLAKRISSRPCNHLAVLSHSPCILFTTQTDQRKNIPFMAQYLISSFGFSMDGALKVSNHSNLSPINSPARPDSVIQFFKRNGFSDAQIKYLISFQPILLSSNVDKTLEPRARELMDAGFTGKTFSQLIQSNPRALNLKNTLLNLQYWREFVGNNDEVLLKIIKKNTLLIQYNLESMVPKINLLKEYGLSQQDIVKMLMRGCCRLFRPNVNVLREFLERTRELGFPRGSGMFSVALRVIGSMKKESWDRKVEFYRKSYGWSEEEVLSAFKKFPPLLSLSTNTVETKMNFLIEKGGIDPESLVSHPVLLGWSLETRLVPRHLALTILKEKGFKRNTGLCTVCCLSEKTFVEKFVEPYKEKVPELSKAYHAACQGEKVVD